MKGKILLLGLLLLLLHMQEPTPGHLRTSIDSPVKFTVAFPSTVLATSANTSSHAQIFYTEVFFDIFIVVNARKVTDMFWNPFVHKQKVPNQESLNPWVYSSPLRLHSHRRVFIGTVLRAE